MPPTDSQEAPVSYQNRSTSAPPQSDRVSVPISPQPSYTSPAHRPSPLGPHPVRPHTRDARPFGSLSGPGQAPSNIRGLTGGKERRVLGIQLRLKKEVDGVVKRRSGAVLGRGFILKTDHYPTGRALDLDLEIQGAPNFRAPDEEGLNVFGVAQPTVPGLKSILTILGCQPDNLLPPLASSSRRASSSVHKPTSQGTGPAKLGVQLEKVLSHPQLVRRISGSALSEKDDGQAIWFSTREETLVYCNGRPYVLRDASTPFQTLNLSNRAGNLEDIETRLKQDILEEARKYGGMILVHDELKDEHLVPTWMSVDERSIRTPKELYEDIREEGWRVVYHRIPIAPDTPIEDAYLDSYVAAIKDVDPISTSLVFNCGMGVVRTTFAMVAASLLRRKQLLVRGYEDAFPKASSQSGIATPSSFANLPGSQQSQATQFLEQAAQQQVLTKSLLQLTQVLDRTLPSRHGTAVDLLTSQPVLLEELRKAHMGNYQMVLSLISSLDHGRQMKQLVDEVIDSCDAVVNLREIVIEYRIKYSASSMDDKTRQALLGRALRALEQYFDLIVFAAYVEEEDAGSTGTTFAAWLMNRPEIWNQIKSLRRQTGNRLAAFAPVNDLSQISKTSEHAESGSGDRPHGRPRDLDLQGGKVLGDEWAEHVVSNRSGIMLRASTLLKSDQWTTDTAPSSEGVRGAVGFRQVPGSAIFTTGQPTQDALSLIVNVVKEKCPAINTLFWICLREEPLVMINGSPYCLRRGSTLLRNMRDYSGVSANRVELLEQRLKSDVITELGQFQGTVLLHTETTDGEVVPVWESVESGDVESIKDVMDGLASSTEGLKLVFFRVPVTSESSPDFHDISQLLDICMRTGLQNTAFILNDQLGRGRSSTTAIMLLLMQRWLRKGGHDGNYPPTPSRDRGRSAASAAGLRKLATSSITSAGSGGGAPRVSWQIINSCLRVIRNGVEVKRVVDEAVDAAAAHFNLRDTIQEFRLKAEESDDPEKKDSYIEKGLYHLRRYYYLLLFQAYLDDRKPDEDEPYTFESWVKHRPVFKTLETELEHGGLTGLTPIDRMELANGMALPDEVAQVVANRSGAILSAQTILKSDFFSGLQKQSLPDRVDGAANYRRMPLIPPTMAESQYSEASSSKDTPAGSEHYVYGTGMPSGPGLRNALVKMGAGPKGEKRIVWTSLREEPVLYIKTRPHVLRLIDKPVNNIETTGVTAAVVERMENKLKEDVLREIRAGEGKLLVHDEVETKPGTYEIIPIWETIEEKDIMTPRELYEEVIKEGYQVDYLRVAITDEQAPLPASLQTIVDRVARGLIGESDFVFNCQMGRGRTTTGMVAASLIATIEAGRIEVDESEDEAVWDENGGVGSEEAQYLNGEYKTILQLVTVLRHGKQAKRLTDRAVDEMEGVQNLRKAVYDFKLKVDAAPAGSAKQRPLISQAVNYLYRYGTLIVLTNFLLECKDEGVTLDKANFPAWMSQHREIRSVLSRKTLD